MVHIIERLHHHDESVRLQNFRCKLQVINHIGELVIIVEIVVVGAQYYGTPFCVDPLLGFDSG